MSLEAAIKFAGKLGSNEALAVQIEKDTAGKDDKAALAAVVALAKAQGFDFTAEEAVQVRTGLTIHLKQQAGEELNEAELAHVSGGFIDRSPIDQIGKPKPVDLMSMLRFDFSTAQPSSTASPTQNAPKPMSPWVPPVVFKSW